MASNKKLFGRSFVFPFILGIIAIIAISLLWSSGILRSNTVKYSRQEDGTKAIGLKALELRPQNIIFDDGSQAEFLLDRNFQMSVAAENLGKARFMTESPDGRIFIPDMVDYKLSHEGRIFILDDFNEDTKRFESTETYLSDLRGPNNVEFYTDKNGDEWIYITLTEHLIRYPYQSGDMEPSGEPEVIYQFPNEQGPGAEDVVWHITRTILFDDNLLYVSVGSGCNLCEEREEDLRAMILTMTPEGENVEIFAEGIKNAVGMEIVDGKLYATENGTDHLGPEAPDDLMFKIEKSRHYGWPYCYELDGKKYPDSSIEWEREPVDCRNVPISFTSFNPHSAPLGLKYFNENSHPTLADSFLVALQGSWDKEIGTGYQVMRVSKGGESDIFIDGFMDESGERIGRPVHILKTSDNSFLISDDYNGRIFYVYSN